MRALLIILTLVFASAVQADSKCSSLLLETQLQPSRPVIAQKNYSLKTIPDIIEVYKPGGVWAVARVVIFRNFNGSIKDYRIINSEGVRLNFDIFSGRFENNIQILFSGPAGTYEVRFAKEAEGIHNTIFHKENLELKN